MISQNAHRCDVQSPVFPSGFKLFNYNFSQFKLSQDPNSHLWGGYFALSQHPRCFLQERLLRARPVRACRLAGLAIT